MRFDIVTLFPESLTGYFSTSILKRAQDNKLIEVHFWNPRDFATDKHKTVDDTPYGGGAGMVMKIEPIHKALQAITTSPTASLRSRFPLSSHEERAGGEVKRRIIVLSAKGQQFTQSTATDYVTLDQLILICGRYEGIDQRVIDHLADEEISVGPYVLAGGELGAGIIAEATARLIPGVLGNQESLQDESHNQTDYTEAPQYTKPENYNGWSVPEVLLSGNHQAIQDWRRNQSDK